MTEGGKQISASSRATIQRECVAEETLAVIASLRSQ